ncbi:hypothetical protein ACFY3M_13770 [Streptomyces mirabilis]
MKALKCCGRRMVREGRRLVCRRCQGWTESGVTAVLEGAGR